MVNNKNKSCVKMKLKHNHSPKVNLNQHLSCIAKRFLIQSQWPLNYFTTIYLNITTSSYQRTRRGNMIPAAYVPN